VALTPCSITSLGKVDALKVFDEGTYFVVYRKDFGELTLATKADEMIKERLEWASYVIRMAHKDCKRFWYDAKWRVSNAQYLLGDHGPRMMGLAAWIQAESQRARELADLLARTKCQSVTEYLREWKP
jgi:hypothetical protein